jgi:hypothetical protein
MRFLLIGYIVFFSLASLVAVVATFAPPEEGEEREGVLEHIMDGITAAALLAGMIFMALDLNEPRLKQIWMVVTPVLGCHAIWTSWRDRKAAVAAGEAQKEPKMIAATDLFTLAMLIPSLGINFWYSFR